jgi:protein subunit release factor A
MTKEQTDEIMKGVIFTPEHCACQPKGGQQVAISPRGVRIHHEEIGIAVFFGEFRNQMENRAAALLLFEQALTLIE